MQQLRVWQITDGGPKRLVASDVGLERYLEDWIERDPDLVQRGLAIVGRQIVVEGGRLDLLALDAQGRSVVIEIKPGAVDQWTVSQALLYAAAISTMPLGALTQKVDGYLQGKGRGSLKALLDTRPPVEDESPDGRDVGVIVVGTARSVGLDPMVTFLARKGNIEVRTIAYQVLEVDDGHKVLVRELGDADLSQPTRPDDRSAKLDALLRQAGANGVGPQLQAIVDAANRHGMYVRPYAGCIGLPLPICGHERCSSRR